MKFLNLHRHRSVGYVLLFLTGCAHAQVLAEYNAASGGGNAADPVASGWKARAGAEAFGTPAIEEEKTPAWKIGNAKSNINQLSYRWNFENNALAYRDWQVRAKLRVVAASSAKIPDAYLEVQDGRNEWTFVFTKDKTGREGISYVNLAGALEEIYSGDISSSPFEVEMKYSAKRDAVSLSMNGETLPKSVGRDHVPAVGRAGRVFLSWGDGSASALPADARSEVYWQSIRLESPTPDKKP